MKIHKTKQEEKPRLLTDCCQADFLRRETFHKTNEVKDYCLKCGEIAVLSWFIPSSDGFKKIKMI